MPQIPGVPTTDPVALPTMSPREAGKPGAVLAGMGEDVLDITMEGLGLQAHIRNAQEQVDRLASGNQMDALVKQMQTDLAKTQNSRDVPIVLQDYQNKLNDLSRQWSGSPAVQKIELNADSLRPGMQHNAEMRQLTLQGNEFKINLDHQGELLSDEYAKGRATGDMDSARAALDGFTATVMSGVRSMLLGDAEGAEIVRRFRQTGQEKQIKQGIANLDPKVNQATFDELNAHPENFPDVPREFIESSKDHALAAREAHIKHQEWADGQMALNTMLRPLIDSQTNPATNQFDEDAALSEVAARFKRGDINISQKEALDAGVKSYGADVNSGLKKKAIKIQDDILKEMHDRNYTKAYQDLETMRPWLENSGYSELYKGLMNYGDTMQRQDRAENWEELQINRQQWQDNSYAQFLQVQQAMAAGKQFSDPEIFQMAGHGPGKMLPQQVTEALQMVHAYEKDPGYRGAIGLMNASIPGPSLPKNPNPEQVASFADQLKRSNERQVLTKQRFDQMVAEHPNEDKIKLMSDALQPTVQKDIEDRLNQMFGDTGKPISIWAPGGGISAQLTPWEQRVESGLGRFFGIKPITPTAASGMTGDYDRSGYEQEFGVGSYERDLAKGHLTDKYKLPNHITFSTDSKYSNAGQKGGEWKQTSGKWYFTPSNFNLSQHGIKEYTNYFDTTEKDSVLRIERDGKLYDYVGNNQWRPVQR